MNRRQAGGRAPGARRSQSPNARQLLHRRFSGCVLRPAAAIQTSSSASVSDQPDDAEVGERLHDVAVRVAHVERLGAVAESRRRIAFCARAERRMRLEHLQRLVPVARSHAADRRQSPGPVRRDRRVRIGDRVQRVRDRAGEAAMACRERAAEREHAEHEHAEQQRAGATAADQRRRLPAGPEAERETDGAQHEQHRQHQHAELVAGVRARRQRDVVVVERRGREVPDDDGAGRDRAAQQDGRAAQAQRHDAEPQHEAEQQRDQRAARVGEQQRQQHQPHRRIGRRRRQRMPGSPGAQPQAPDRAHRRRQPDRVPVVEGSA